MILYAQKKQKCAISFGNINELHYLCISLTENIRFIQTN